MILDPWIPFFSKQHSFLQKVQGVRVIFGAKRRNLTGLRRTRPDATCIMLQGGNLG